MKNRYSLLARAFLAGVIASQSLLLISLGADRGTDLLRAVADNYDSMPSYEVEGDIVSSLPNTDCEIAMSFQAARPERARRSPLEIHSSLPPEIRFHGGKLSQPCILAMEKLGAISSPAWWIDFSAIDRGVTGVRGLQPKLLQLNRKEVQCTGLEVQYDEYSQKINQFVGVVRYWIDSSSMLVRKVEFVEASEQGPRPWIATIERIQTGGEPPSWLPSEQIPYAQPTLIGKPAPDFELRSSVGETVHLAELRGKVVLLAFWATWCTACKLEIPMFEKLQSDPSHPAVVLGMTDEDSETVKGWARKYDRTFCTLTDAQAASKAFGVGALPVLVVIDRKGVVLDYVLGDRSESQLRRIIGRAFAN